jgi:hypothetical protein
MARRGLVIWVAVVAVLGGGCGPGGPGRGGSDRLHQQARDALDRYDKAVSAAGGQRFVPVGELTGQVGDWEPANGDNNKRALLSGSVRAVAELPGQPPGSGTVVWENGVTQALPLVSATEALDRWSTVDPKGCQECVPLEVTGARLTTVRLATTRGPATVPAWEYTLKGTAVRVTRPAVATSATVTVVPPSWDPYNTPGGLAIDSATTTTSSKQLTVTFTGAPDPATKPCGVDYTGEAVESANAVVVIVVAHPHAPGETCTSIGANRTTTVELAAPLGERAVLEVQQGLPVPVTVTG